METDCRQEAYENLIQLAESQGYVTFENIMDCADKYSLSIQAFDWLSNSITTRGVIIYSDAPSNNQQLDDEYDDYAQSDYDKVYSEIIQLNPSLEGFVINIKNILPPQRGEIKQLKYQIADGNSYARKRMIEMHLRIALRVALQRAKLYDIDIEDIIGYACIGLVTAVDKYNPDTSGAFASYAFLWIMQKLSREQTTQRPLIYFPVHQKENYFTMFPLLKKIGCIECDSLLTCEKAQEMIKKELGCNDNESFGVIYQMIHDEYIDDLFEKYSYEADMYLKDFDTGEVLGYLSADTIISEEDAYISSQHVILKEIVAEILNTLTPKERKVLRLRYGFEGQERTLEEVSKEFHVTRERIRQIERRALRNLQHQTILNRLKGYI